MLSNHSGRVLRCRLWFRRFWGVMLSFHILGVTSSMQHSHMRTGSPAFQQLFVVQRHCVLFKSFSGSSASSAVPYRGPFTTTKTFPKVHKTRCREFLVPGFSSSSYLHVFGNRFGPVYAHADRSWSSNSESDETVDIDSQNRMALSAFSRRHIQDLAKEHGLRCACLT